MIDYSEDLKFWLSLVDLNQVGGVSIQQHKKIADIVLQENPNIIMETGVCAGSSTVTILECLKQLNNGILYSIDDLSLIKKFTGVYVTEDLLKYWKFIQSKSKDYLSLLDKNFVVDIFLHDSEHTYDNMKLEYLWGFEHVKRNGWIISHDIDNNSAWEDFCSNIKDRIVDSFQIYTLAGVKLK